MVFKLQYHSVYHNQVQTMVVYMAIKCKSYQFGVMQF